MGSLKEAKEMVCVCVCVRAGISVGGVERGLDRKPP